MNRFLTKISITHNLDTDLLLSDWKQFEETNTQYNKMKKPELVDLCKEKGFKSTGSKIDLIGYLFDEVVAETKEVKVKPVKATAVDTAVAKKSIIEKLNKATPVIAIRRNEHNNYEHAESGFVFDQKTKNVIGKQQGDTVVPICKADIDICNKYSFKYDIPESLGVAGEVDEVVDQEIVDEIDEHVLLETTENDDGDDSDEEIEY
jgi:hypothetical protein